MATINMTRMAETVMISDGLYSFTCTVDEFLEKNKGNALGFVREASKKTPGDYIQGVNIYCGKSAATKVDYTKDLSEKELKQFKSIRAKIKKSLKGAIELEFIVDQQGFLDALQKGFTACETTTKKVKTAVEDSLFDEIGIALPSTKLEAKTETEAEEETETEEETEEETETEEEEE